MASKIAHNRIELEGETQVKDYEKASQNQPPLHHLLSGLVERCLNECQPVQVERRSDADYTQKD